MITNDNKNWHYLAVKSLSRLLRGITSNHIGDFYCLNCFHSYRTKERLKKHEKTCKDHNYCYVKMADEDKKILKYNAGEKSLKVPFMIYADLECLVGKIDTCQNDPKKSSTEKKAEHMPSGYWVRLLNNESYYECKECNDESYKSINGLIKKFPNTYRFCNGDVNKFFLLLRKGAYPYEYMDNKKKFNKTSLPDKETFYIELNKESFTHEDYAHAQNFGKYLK